MMWWKAGWGSEPGRTGQADAGEDRGFEANFLVLDEPTNRMDYSSLEVVESALRAFRGAILLVSTTDISSKQ